MNAFAARQKAAEGQWFNTEERLAVMRHLERLVDQGKVDKSLLEAARQAHDEKPTLRGRTEEVFEYKPGSVPMPRLRQMDHLQLGTRVSLGRSRWTSDDVSVFSVADAKRMASTPPKAVTAYEAIRMAKIQRAALETPQIGGYRLLPEMTPGRAFLWGTILAIWGTAAAVTLATKQLDIRSKEEAPGKLKALFVPVAASLKAHLAPWKDWLSIGTVAQSPRDNMPSELVSKLRASLG